MKIFERSVWSLITAFFAILMIISFVGSAIAMNYEGQINSALGINVFRRVANEDDASIFTDYYKSDYFVRDAEGNVVYTVNEDNERVPKYDDAAMRANSMAVARKTADESSVLLWNDGALPLAQGAKIGFFGVSSQRSRYIYSGTGSGYIAYSGSDDIKSKSEENGLDVYDALWNLYRMASSEYGYALVGSAAAGVDDRNYGEYRINEAPWDELQRFDDTLTGSVLEETDNYKDAAVMVISRNGGEDYDTNFDSDTDECADDCYLDLSKAEQGVLRNLCDLKEQGKVNSVILLVNSATPVQTMTIDDYDIDACAWVGMGGTVAAEQVANLLSGKVNPSGHLVDTWVKDTDSAPVNENFGDHTFTSSKGLPPEFTYTHNDKYLVYQEGIYVGYKYYETRYEDYVLGRGNADSAKGVKAGSGAWNYSDEVAYSFGHGESYTTFAYSDYKVEETADGEYEVSLTITNTGSVPGKDAMQVYIQKPYTAYDKDPAHPVEKAAVELVAFAKTDMLYPASETGKPNSQTLTVTVSEYDFKSYDAYGAGTYILEKGDYYLATGTSSHDALNNILAAKPLSSDQKARMDAPGNASLAHKITVAEDDFETYSVSPYTGAEVKNLFSNADINLYEGTADQKITYLSRNDWDATYPSPVEMTCVNDKMIADMQYYTGITEDPDATVPTYETVTSEDGALSLVMLMEREYDDPIWGDLMNQTSYAEQTFLVTYGAHVLAGAESVNAPGGLSQNGPSGINQPNPVLGTCMIFPCQVNMASTWNTPLIEELGNAFGMEMMHVGYEGLNGPGANIHRSAYSGRNWEYFSEDGVMTGEMLSAETVGLMNRGCILYVKHMLLNDEERNRYGVSIWANEQSIREVYAKAFEKSCAVTGLNGIMSSFNRIGTTWAGRHKGLLNDLLRGEWGFEGAVQSDAAVGRHMGVANDAHTNAAIFAEALIAGQDFWLMGGSTTWLDEYKDNATVACALREAARRMLYTQLHSHAMNGITSDDVYVRITPWWQNALLGLRIATVIVTFLCAAMTVLSFVFSSKAFKNYVASAPERRAAKEAARKAAEQNAVYGGSGGVASAYGGASGGYTDYSGDGTVAKPSAFAKHKKTIIAAIAVAAAVILILAIVLPVTMCGGSSEPPVPPGQDDNPVVAECTHKCPVCGGCMDEESTLEACAVKCGADRTGSYTFEAENRRVERTSGSMGAVSVFTDRTDVSTGEYVSGIGNFSSNTGASITFNVSVAETTTVTLLARVSRGTGGVTRFTDVALPMLTNAEGGELLDRSTMVERTETGTWFDFQEVNLGCVTLTEGENSLKIAPVGTAYNFDYVAFLSDVPVTWSDGSEADIVGTPRHGVYASVTGAVTNSDGTVSATVATTKDLTAAESVTVGGNEVGEFSVAASGENTYAFSADVSGLGLTADSEYTVRFFGESGELIAMGRFVYSDYVPNVNTAERDESGWNELDFRALSAPQSQTLSEGVEMSSGCQITTTRPNNDKYYPIGNLDTAKGRYVTFYVESSADTEAALYMELGNLGAVNKFADWADLTVNGTKYTSDADMPAGTQYEASNTFVRIGYIPLREGQNAITFTVNNTASFTAHNIYGIKLLSPDATITSASVPDPDDSEWTAYDFTAYSAPKSEVLADGVEHSPNLTPTTGRPDDDGYYPIGGLDAAKGSYVTFYINSDAAVEKAGLYMELSNLGKGEENAFDDWLDLTVNGEDYDSSADMPVSDERYTPSNEWTLIRFVPLKAGENVITFTVNSSEQFNGHNIYGIRLTAETAKLTHGTVPGESEDADWTTYDFAAREGSGLAAGVDAVGGEANPVLGAPEHRANKKDEIPIGDLNGNKGATVTFTVHSDSAARAGIYIELSRRSSDVTFGQFLDLAVNGSDVSDADAVALPRCATTEETFTPSNEYTFLCFADLIAGDNTITFTVNSDNTNVGANIYGIRLTAESAVITAGGAD